MLDYLRAIGRARRHLAWACYHTELYTFEHDGITMGLIGRVVGASFAVLVAEELFVLGTGSADRSSLMPLFFVHWFPSRSRCSCGNEKSRTRAVSPS